MGELALLLCVGLAGPLLAIPSRFQIPIVLGEICAGVFCGPSFLNLIRAPSTTTNVLSTIGFALVMMVVGSHINVREMGPARGLFAPLRNVIMVFGIAVVITIGLKTSGMFGHPELAAVIMASSSAAVVLPLIDRWNQDTMATTESTSNKGEQILSHRLGQLDTLMTQVAIADTLAIVAIPFVTNQSSALQGILGIALVTAGTFVIFVSLRFAQTRGWWKWIHQTSKTRGLGLELRISLILLFSLAALAQKFHISVMIAGFGLGLALAANGVPHRLARQLFAVAEGFFAPLFFVILGTRIDIRAVFTDRHFMLLSIFLASGALASHAITRVVSMPLPYAVMSASQLGIPVAAVTIGQQSGMLNAGESGAIMLAAVITMLIAGVAVRQSR